MQLAVQVSVAARAGQQMQAFVPLTADVRPIRNFGMHASLFAPIAGANQPDAAEIGVKTVNYSFGYAGQFGFQSSRREERLQQLIYTFLMHCSCRLFLFRQLAGGNVFQNNTEQVRRVNVLPGTQR
jgi:hypothetical protein